MVSLAKFEAQKKKLKERGNSFLGPGGPGGDEDSKTEIDELAAKIEKLELPEETK